MNNELHNQIYNELNLRETEDLLETWQHNDRVEWSDEAFEVIKEILQDRGIEVPPQDEPINEYDEEEVEDEDYDFSDVESRIINNENPPDFFDPFEVLELTRWIDLAAEATIVLSLIQGLLNSATSYRIARSYFIENPDSTGVNLVTFLFVAANIAIGILLTYFPLKALSRILRILMEMEFNSRKRSQPNPLVE